MAPQGLGGEIEVNIAPGIIDRYNRHETNVLAEWTDANSHLVAKNVADALSKHYPGWFWGCTANVHEGCIVVLNFQLSGEVGHVIKLQGLFSWDNLRDLIVREAGELLERYGMPRGRFDFERYNALPKDFRGLPVGEVARKN